MAKASNPDDASQAEHFEQLIIEHQTALRRYIFVLVPEPIDADEILQETNLAICRSFEDFAPNTSFRAWSFRIAYHRVLELRKRKRRRTLFFSDRVISLLASDAEQHDDELETRSEMLRYCLDRLRAKECELIDLHYREGLGGPAIAARIGISVGAVYMALSRIRKSLMECISRQLSSKAGG